MKRINLLIRELDNCSLGGDFRVSWHAENSQFDHFSSEINFEKTRSCNYGIPRLVQVKMKILHMFITFMGSTLRAGICVASVKLTTFGRRIVNRLYQVLNQKLRFKSP